MNFESNGKGVWYEKVFKRQHSSRDGGIYGGIHVQMSKDKINVIFADKLSHVPGLTISEGEDPKKYKGLQFIHVSVSFDGTIEFQSLGKVQRKTRPVSGKFIRLGNGESLIYMANKSQHVFGRIIFE